MIREVHKALLFIFIGLFLAWLAVACSKQVPTGPDAERTFYCFAAEAYHQEVYFCSDSETLCTYARDTAKAAAEKVGLEKDSVSACHLSRVQATFIEPTPAPPPTPAPVPPAPVAPPVPAADAVTGAGMT